MQALILSAEWQPRSTEGPEVHDPDQKRTRQSSRVWRHPTLRVEEVSAPALGPTDVLIEVGYCGICGSDLHMSLSDDQGYMVYPGLTALPTTIGHEFSGRIVEVGADVRTLHPGDLVTSEQMWWCGRCTPCRRGYFNHCTNLEELGFTVPGAMAPVVAVDEKYCWSLDAVAEHTGSADEALVLGALVEPTSVSYNALFVRNPYLQPGQYVVLFGAGPIGLTALALTLAAGFARTIVVEPAPERRRIAQTLGADVVLDPADGPIDELLLEATEGAGVDLAVEAAGKPGFTIAPLKRSLGVNASVCYIARTPDRPTLDLETFIVRRAQLYGSQGHSGDGIFQHVIRLMASGRLNLRPLVSDVVGLDETHDAFRRLKERQAAKILIDPSA